MARTVIRTFIEHRQLNEDVFDDALNGIDLQSIAEVGAGYGRIAAFVARWAKETTAFEREPHMIAAMRRLVPDVEAVQVAALTSLPAEDESFDLVLSFTVLQHMSDTDATGVLAEMARISRRYVLVVEDTDPDHHYVDPKNKTHFTHGRDAGWYSDHLPDFEIVNYWPREVEPGFTYRGQPRPTVGEYMLFERASNDDGD
jgi:ubiquinone/menaquinone biosynthesis C-methylase UbiE